jgi:hypothetical protein
MQEEEEHHDIQFDCSGCNKNCATIGALKAHEKTCSTLRPVCSSCGVAFKSQAALSGHRSRGVCHKADTAPKRDRAVRQHHELARLKDFIPGAPAHDAKEALVADACYVNIEAITNPSPGVKFAVSPSELRAETDAFTDFLSDTLMARGATDYISDKTQRGYVNVFKSAMAASMVETKTKSAQDAMHRLNDADVFEHVTNSLLAHKVGHQAPSPNTKLETVRKLHIVLDFFTNTRGIDLADAHVHVEELLKSLRREARRQNKEASTARELSGVADIFGAADDGAPSFQDRQLLRQIHNANLVAAIMSERFDPVSLKEAFLVSLTEAIIPNRKETIQHLRLGVPPPPSMEAAGVGERYFISFRAKTGAYVLTSLQNKQNRNLCLDLPPELTTTLEMYFASEVGDGEAVFPRAKSGNSLADKQFGLLERAAYQQTSTTRATVQNARHAVANEVAPHIDMDMKESYAAAMNTSTRYLFGIEPNLKKSSQPAAYATKCTKVAVAFSAVQHHRFLVFKAPYSGFFLFPTLTRRGRVAEWGVGKVIATTPLVAKVMLLELVDDDLYNVPDNDASVVVLELPLRLANVAPLSGTYTPTKSGDMWLIKKEHFQAVALAAEQKSIRLDAVPRTNAAEVALEHGQLVVHAGVVAEVRKSDRGVAILRYSAVPRPDSATEWMLKHDEGINIVTRAELNIALDWDVTRRGTVVVHA